jgi:LysR family glycine cleavage system transcriptional activator
MLPELRQGFDLIAAGMARAAAATGRSTLVVSLTPSVAAKWLMPRLERFTGMHPDIEIRLDTTTRLASSQVSRSTLRCATAPGNGPGYR